MATVPNVVGEPFVTATAAFIAAGLILGTSTIINDEVTGTGLVLFQTPAAGATAAPGSAVNVIVSAGPANPQRIGAVKIVLQKANNVQVQFAYSPLGTL
jgi:beta-lactam-binding protein with PASTA domain